MTDINTELVKELADILDGANLTELTIEHGDMCISLKKEVGAVMAAPAVAAMTAAPVSVAASAPTEQKSVAAPAASGAGVVKSPMVGTAYLHPEPGAAAFISIGDKVRKGQTILLIEAMKTFNAVEAPRDGVVQNIIVADSQPVEFDEPLVVIS